MGKSLTLLILGAFAALAAAAAWFRLARDPALPSAPPLAAAGTCAAGACGLLLAARGAWRQLRRGSIAAEPADDKERPKIIRLDEIPQAPDKIFCGWGVPLTWQTAQAIADMGNARGSDRPQEWKDITRTLLARSRLQPIMLPLGMMFEHIRIHGSTGTGKSRMLELISVQLARRPEFAIAFIDPKCDKRMADQLWTVSHRYAKEFHFFSPQLPSISIPYNPLRDFAEPRDVADRIKPLLPSSGEGEPYAQTQWEATLAFANALVDLGITPSFWRLRHHAEQGGREVLFHRLLRKYYPEGQWPPDPRACAYAYLGLVGKYEGRREAPAWFSPSSTVAGLVKFILQPEYYSKMIGSLLPLLAKLSDGALRDLLSPEDHVNVLTWARVERKHAIAYFYLSALTGIETGSGLGAAASLDLLNHIGRKFSYRYAEIASTPMALIMDEFGDCATVPMLGGLSKGRSAGLMMIIACQTMQDVVAKLNLARARQIETNTRIVIHFRAAAEDARGFCEHMDDIPVALKEERITYAPSLFSSGDLLTDDFKATFQNTLRRERVSLVPQGMLTSLPKWHFILAQGSEVWLGYIPLLEDPTRDYIREATDRLNESPPRGHASHRSEDDEGGSAPVAA